jgi:hypothetical protein
MRAVGYAGALVALFVTPIPFLWILTVMCLQYFFHASFYPDLSPDDVPVVLIGPPVVIAYFVMALLWVDRPRQLRPPFKIATILILAAMLYIEWNWMDSCC